MEEKIHRYWSIDGKKPASSKPTNAEEEIQKIEDEDKPQEKKRSKKNKKNKATKGKKLA